jgi:DNA-binding transcriptional LysR family regulator
MSNDDYLLKLRHLSAFDMNLVVTFELVYFYKSVTQAAEDLNVSSSAVSQSLRKLRDYFEDPLFIRTGNNTQPTVFAEKLHSELQKSLQHVSEYIAELPPGQTKLSLVVSSPESLFIDLLPHLINVSKTNNEARNIIHNNVNISGQDVEDILMLRKTDLVFSMTPVYNAMLTCVQGATRSAVLVCRKDYDGVGNSISAEEFNHQEIISFNTNDQMYKLTQEHMNALIGRTEIKSVFSSDSNLSIYFALQHVDGVSFISQRAYETFKDTFNLRIVNTEFELPQYSFYMIYRKSSANDMGFMTIINGISTVF